MLLFACGRERLTFSVFAGDVQLDSGGPRDSSGGPAPWRDAPTPTPPSPVRTNTLAARLSRWASQPLHDLINTVFPADCQVCGGPVLRPGRVPVCDTCETRLLALDDSSALCSRCGDALAPESLRFAAAHSITECTACRLAPPEFARAVAFAAYDDTTRELLQLLKFQGMAAVAQHLLADGMAQALRKLLSEIAPDALVIPVPLFAARERSRGFNQATLLARAGLARLRTLDPACQFRLRTDLLERTRDTRSSFALDPHTRRENLRGAFRIQNAKADALRGRDILLVDDILTTGATARECARVLRRAGAASVWVATYARTFPDGASLDAQVARWGHAEEPGPPTTFPSNQNATPFRTPTAPHTP